MATSTIIDPVVLINDPTVFDKKTAEESLKEQISKYYSNSSSGEFGQIFNEEICIINNSDSDNKTIWKKFERPSKAADLVDGSSWGEREDNISKRMSEFKILDKLTTSYNIYQIPEGTATISCNVDMDIPCMFALSISKGNYYFDTVIIPENLHENGNVLCWLRTEDINIPYKHSGDARRGQILFHGMFLKDIETMKDDKNHFSGCIVFQGFQQKTFNELKDCEPNICIVDKDSDGSFHVWVYHFPLIRDFVGDASIAYMAKFDYYPENKKIIWSFLKRPLFSSKLFSVGCTFSAYKSDFQSFNHMLNQQTMNEKINDANKMITEEEKTCERTLKKTKIDAPPVVISSQEYNNNNNNLLIMVQEPILNSSIKNLVDYISNCPYITKKYKFHHNIKYYSDKDDDIDKKNNTPNFSLPIAGGSVISEHTLIRLAKPMKNLQISVEYKMDITYSKKAIVIISSDYSIANTPKMFKKLNACFIVVNNDSSGHEKTADTNISLALIQQGPLSTVFSYFPTSNKFFFIRGLCPDKNYGDEVNLTDIINTYGWINDKPQPLLSVPAFPQSTKKQFIYDKKGNEIFCFDMNDCDNPTTVLTAIKKYADEITAEGEKKLKLALNWILAQLEVIINPVVFNSMIKMLVTEINDGNKITKGRAFKLLLEFLSVSDKDEEIENNNEAFNVTWLVQILNERRNLAPQVNRDDFKQFGTLVANVRRFINKNIEKSLINSIILESLRRCVSTKSSYGTRTRDIEKMIKIHNNVLKSKWLEPNDLDNIFLNGCEQEGVLIYEIKSYILDEIVRSNGDYNSLTFLSRDNRFLDVSGDMAITILESTMQGRGVNTCLFEYQNKTMIIIPILDEIINIMSSVDSITNYKWNMAIADGRIDFTRIMLRNSIAYYINMQFSPSPRIEGNSSLVGKIVLQLLCNALKLLTTNINISQPTQNDGIIKRARGVMGLLFSVMASGNVPLTSVYQIFLHDNFNPHFNFVEDIYLIDNIIEFWPWMKVNDLPVKTNAVKFVQRKIDNVIQAIISSESSSSSSKSNEIKKMLKLREKQKKIWTFNKIRPLIGKILNLNNNIDYDKPTSQDVIHISSKKIKLLIPQKRNLSQLTLSEQEVKEIENRMANYIKNRQNYYLSTKNPKRLRNERYNVPISDEDIKKVIPDVLKYIKEEIETDEYFQCNKFKSKLIQNIHRLKEVYTPSVWKEIKSIAYDYYIKKSAILKIYMEPLLIQLNEIIINNKNEHLQQLRQLRAQLFKVFFNAHNIFYDFGYIPRALVGLSACNTIEDFLYIYTGRRFKDNNAKKNEGDDVINNVKGFEFVLINFIKNSDGHFNNLSISTYINEINDEERALQKLREERKEKILKKIEDEHTNLKQMWSWCVKHANNDYYKTLNEKIESLL